MLLAALHLLLSEHEGDEDVSITRDQFVALPGLQHLKTKALESLWAYYTTHFSICEAHCEESPPSEKSVTKVIEKALEPLKIDLRMESAGALSQPAVAFEQSDPCNLSNVMSAIEKV